MKILVTGGAGFIGSNLAMQLLHDGHEVTLLDNLSSGYRANLDALPDARFIEGDIRDEDILDVVTQGVEVVFHSAASVGNKRSIDNPILDAEINVLGTVKVLEAARKAGVRKIVSASSAGIFGELKTLPINEDHPIDPDTPYAATKLCSEKECLAYSRLYDIEAVCLRYFNVYGANQRFDAYGNVIPIFAFTMLKNQAITIFGDGEQTRDFVEVRDVVQANIKAALSKGVSGAFNIASGTRITINSLVELLSDASGICPKVLYGPNRPGDVLHSLADINSAANAFGYKPEVSLKRGTRDFMDWAKTEAKYGH
ncbi:MAG: SDR family oxidoreductase [Pseudomonadales bacterium]|nr:SDR family oxidoreductase [Pseudomonadales bacterium]